MKKQTALVLGILLVSSMALSACSPKSPEVSEEPKVEAPAPEAAAPASEAPAAEAPAVEAPTSGGEAK